MARVATAAALLGLFCAAALAQTEPEMQLISVNNFHGDLELRYDYDRDYVRDRQPPAATTLEVDQYFDEIMKLSGDGFILHPRFLTYNAAVGLDLTQGSTSVESPTGIQNSSLNDVAPEYAISGSLLPQNAVSLNFSLSQFTSTLNPLYGPVTKDDEQNQSATLSLRNDLLPIQLGAGHEISNETQMGFGENRYEEDSWGQISATNNIGPSSSSLSYKYFRGHEEDEQVSDVTSEFRVETEIQTAVFNNTLRLGEGNWATLTSRANLNDETGTYPLDQFTEDESLVLQHTKNLSTQYGFDYSRVTVGAETTDLTSLQASLSHHLYESLFTNFRVFGSHEDYTPSSEDIEGFSLSEIYRKRIPWGTLTVDAGAGYEVTDNRTQPGLVSIVNESQTLTDGIVTFLHNPNVVISTVVVTNTAGTLTYVLNVDYTLTPQGTLTQIQRLPTGAIANGGSVAVRYQYESDLPLKYGTTDLHGRVAVDLFKHLTLYVNRSSLENSVLSGVNQGELVNLEETLFGASIRWDPATLTAEHEIYDSSIAPYVSDRVSFNAASAIGETQRVSAAASYNHVRFSGNGGGAETLRTLTLAYQATPKNWPSFSVTAGYEWENEAGVATEYEYGRIALEYHIRGTILSLQYQINHTNASPTTELSQYAFFSIRRRLF